MKVMMFGKATKQTEASQPPTDEALLAMQKFNEELEKAGVLLDLGASRRPAAACACSTAGASAR